MNQASLYFQELYQMIRQRDQLAFRTYKMLQQYADHFVIDDQSFDGKQLQHTFPSLWEDKPPDRLFDLARGLNQLWLTFEPRLKAVADRHKLYCRPLTDLPTALLVVLPLDDV